MSQNDEKEEDPDQSKADSARTIRTLTAFLRGVGSSLECPFCKQTNWYIQKPPDQDYRVGLALQAVPPIGSESPERVGGFLEVDILTCSNCGFVRPHRRALVDRWHRGRKSRQRGKGSK